MAFINNKVAIITGGSSGIGLAIAKSFLENNAKGVTIVDCNPQGQEVVLKLAQDCTSKVIFVCADVSVNEEFEQAFLETVKAFGYIDILVNNAGILDDSIWEQEIQTNLNGTIHGCLLAIHQYMPAYKSEQEGVIINLSSTAGLEGYPNIPIYSATKHAIIGLGRSWGHPKHFAQTNIRVLTVCPNATKTPLLLTMAGKNLGPRYEKIFNETPLPKIQIAEDVAKSIVEILNVGESGTVWLVEDGHYCEANLPSVDALKTF